MPGGKSVTTKPTTVAAPPLCGLPRMKREAFAYTSTAEQEVVIRLDRTDGQAHIGSCWPSVSRRLCKRYGPPSKVSKSSRDGRITCAWWVVPLRCVSFRSLTPRKAPRTPAGIRSQDGGF